MRDFCNRFLFIDTIYLFISHVKGEPELTDPPELTVVARIQYYHKNVLLNKRSFNFITFLVLHLLIN